VKNTLLIQYTVLAALTLISACSPRTLTTTLDSTSKSIEGDKPYTIVETSHITSITDITQDSVIIKTTIGLETTNEATATVNTTGMVQSTALLATTSILNTTIEPTLLDVTKIAMRTGFINWCCPILSPYSVSRAIRPTAWLLTCKGVF
jgi:hypothetical protein